MNRFAELLDRLVLTPSRNGKLTLLTDYFRAVEDPDRGLALAAIYALGVLSDLLFPSLFQTYRFWENVLIGVAWTVPWTLLIGLFETFLIGALVIWAGMAIYQALPRGAPQ